MTRFFSFAAFFAFCLFAIYFAPGISAHARSQEAPRAEGSSNPPRYTQIEIITDQDRIEPGGTVEVGVVQHIHPGWHTYWKNPGDSGEPTSVSWDLPSGFTAAELRWPAPQKLPFGPLTNYGYEGRPILLQTLRAPQSLPEGPIEIDMRIDLLVCHDICIPETAQKTLVLNRPGTGNVRPGLIDQAQEKLPSAQGWETVFYRQDGRLFIDVAGRDEDLLSHPKSIALFPEEWGLVNNSAGVRAVVTEQGLTLSQGAGERDLEDVPVSKLVLTYKDTQGQDAAVRLSALRVAGGRAAPLSGPGADAAQGDLSLAGALFLALLGGIILNLMPCVFPILSMKALGLASLKDKEQAQARRHGLAYTGGIVVSFAAISALLIALRAGGEQIGWGFQLQNPVIVFLLAGLIFVIGLNLAGFFEIKNAFTNLGTRLTRNGHYSASFFTGLLATLVATPCTAPFMAAALGYTLTQPAISAFAVFLMLGIGLALPYMLLCYVPAFRHILPRPGPWMVVFREILAFPMFATAVWLISVLGDQTGNIGVFAALSGLVCVAFSLWLFEKAPAEPGPRRRVLHLAAIVVLFAGLALPIATMPKITAQTPRVFSGPDKVISQDFSNAALRQALNGDHPVFVNMTAAWCITCKMNELVALKSGSVRALFEDHDVIYLKGDWTKRDPTITAYLNGHGRQGVPLYVYYGARDDKSGARPAAKILPQILTPGMFRDLLEGEE